MSLVRRRSGQIMALFYRLVATYLWHEKVLARSAPSPEARDRLRAAMWARMGRRYHDTALAMGGLLIKAGQLLSARADIFPTEFTRELASLQDTVPGVPYAAIREAVESEFGRPIAEVFASFEPEPLAAASLGQVHRAVLPDGEPVVVKVLRPGVERLIRADLEGFRRVVRALLRWTRWAHGLDLPGVYYESYHILLRELDLRDEARHTVRFAALFEDEPNIAIPTVYEAYSRQRVLTLSYMPGIKVADQSALAAAGVDTSALAGLLVRALSRQVLGEGFFHADPHPGNLLVQPGPTPTLVLLDFGMVGQLTPRHRHAFRRLGLGLLSRDPDTMVAALDELEMLRPLADRAALRRAIAWLFEKQLQGDIFELRPEAFLEIANEIRQLFQTQAFQFPADIAFLGRGTTTTLGVCRTLDPEGNFIGMVEASTRAYLGAEGSRSITDVGAELARLPARLDRVLTVIEKGGAPGRPVEAPARRASRWGYGALAGVAFVGGNQWAAMARPGVAVACWTLAALALLWWGVRSLPPSPPEP